LLCLLPAGQLSGQGLAGSRNEDGAIMVYLGYGPYSTAGDLADRFGGGWSVDGGVSLVPRALNLEFGLRAQFSFGDQVKEDPLASLRTDEGFLIGNQRAPADIQLRYRSLFIGPSLGYTLKIGTNQRAGLHLKSTFGYLFHKIRFQKDPIQRVPQLDDEFLPGYDRLTGGFAIHQFVGYQQLALDGVLNFYIGGELTAGFTSHLRQLDFDTGLPPSPDGRTDLILGFKAGLIVPFYLGEGREIFYK
jgi:hypothetical protein